MKSLATHPDNRARWSNSARGFYAGLLNYIQLLRLTYYQRTDITLRSLYDQFGKERIDNALREYWKRTKDKAQRKATNVIENSLGRFYHLGKRDDDGNKLYKYVDGSDKCAKLISP
jgi:hypothetical protein